MSRMAGSAMSPKDSVQSSTSFAMTMRSAIAPPSQLTLTK